jgi:predicted phosphodiesterase
VVGGDVAAGPLPAETLDALAELEARYVMGNADRLMVAAYDRGDDPETLEHPIEKLDAWCAQRITQEQRDRLAAYEATVSVDGILFCHGSPRSDEEIITAVSPEARLAPMLAGVAEATVVCGHTHHQFDRTAHGIRVVNAGSVGMPYEGRPGAFWAMLGPDVELRETAYDLDMAEVAVLATGFPGGDELVDTLRSPPTADEVARHFESLAIG